MRFGPSTLGAVAKTRLESKIKKFTPHCIHRPDIDTSGKPWMGFQVRTPLTRIPVPCWPWLSFQGLASLVPASLLSLSAVIIYLLLFSFSRRFESVESCGVAPSADGNSTRMAVNRQAKHGSIEHSTVCSRQQTAPRRKGSSTAQPLVPVATSQQSSTRPRRWNISLTANLSG